MVHGGAWTCQLMIVKDFWLCGAGTWARTRLILNMLIFEAFLGVMETLSQTVWEGGGATDLTRGLLFCLQWYIAAVLSIQYREYENLCSRVQMLLWCEKMRTIANLSFFPPFMWHTTCTNPSKKIIKKNIDRNIWDIVVAQVWSYNWGWVFFSELPNPMLTHIKWESAHIYSKIPMIDFQYYSIW